MEDGFRETVLLVEDTPSLSMVYQAALERASLRVEPVFSAREANEALRRQSYRIVLLDLMLPDGNGLDILRQITARTPSTKTVVITADGSINRAVEAMRCGAFDFLVKPFDDRRLFSAVQNAIRSLKDEDASAETAPLRVDKEVPSIQGFVGSSSQMTHIYDMIRSIGKSTATVFITGESGVGKELCAQAVHAASARSSGPFIALNCGAIPTDLLESEVFGHLKGSFTGAISDKTGAVGAADGGTLFLDELCEMDVRLQTKLLRFLETATITPVGATRPQSIDVRIICATNREPQAEVAAGRFREDLYYRLFVLPVEVPPLRERGADVLEIAESLLHQFAKEEGKTFTGFSNDAKRGLLAAQWPGNVRELRNVIRQAVVMEDGGAIGLDALMLPGAGAAAPGLGQTTLRRPILTPTQTPDAPPAVEVIAASNDNADIDTSVEAAAEVLCRLPMVEIERLIIDAAIDRFGSAPKAAKSLRVSPSTIYRKKESWDGRDTDAQAS